MSETLDTINSSAALGMGRSQHVGTATDDSIVMVLVGKNVLLMGDGEESPNVIIIQKVGNGQSTFAENNSLNRFKSLHLPPQIVEIDAFALTGCTIAQELDIKNVEIIGENAFGGLGVESSKPLQVHLDKVKKIGAGAFEQANADIYLNEYVEEVQEEAFAVARRLHYKGNLEGAPWGALEWIKD